MPYIIAPEFDISEIVAWAAYARLSSAAFR